MIGKHVRPRQPGSVMPAWPTHASAYKQFFTPHPAVPASACVLAPRHHDEIRQTRLSPQIPAIRNPLYTCVSYGPATTTRHIRHLSDTNHLSSDTKSVEMSNASICVSTPTVQYSFPQPRRNPPTPSHPHKAPPCDSFVSYGPDTAMRRMRRLPDTKEIVSATETVARSYLARDGLPSKFPPHSPQHPRRNTSTSQSLLVVSPLGAKHPRHAPAPSPAQQSEACTTNDIIVHRIPSHPLGWVRVQGTWRANAQH